MSAICILTFLSIPIEGSWDNKNSLRLDISEVTSILWFFCVVFALPNIVILGMHYTRLALHVIEKPCKITNL